jgi:hypothetical protein
MADPQFCALCGNEIAGAGQFVIEGTACDDCWKKREHARARKLMPLALAALFCALVPLAVGYATIKQSNKYSSSTTVKTRILIFSSAETSGFDARPIIEGGADPGPTVHSYSDPVAMVFGGVAAALGLAGVLLALKKGNQRSAIFAGVAAAAGIWQALRGAGVV